MIDILLVPCWDDLVDVRWILICDECTYFVIWSEYNHLRTPCSGKICCWGHRRYVENRKMSASPSKNLIWWMLDDVLIYNMMYIRNEVELTIQLSDLSTATQEIHEEFGVCLMQWTELSERWSKHISERPQLSITPESEISILSSSDYLLFFPLGDTVKISSVSNELPNYCSSVDIPAICLVVSTSTVDLDELSVIEWIRRRLMILPCDHRGRLG